MPEPTSVYAAYKLGLEYLPYNAPPVPIFVRQTVAGTTDGPCELLFRQLEMLPIDDLDKKSAYTIGIVVRFAGFLLDQCEEDPDVAMRLHGELAEATQRHMEGYRAGLHGPYSHEIFASHFLHLYPLDNAEDEIRAKFAAYVQYALQQQPRPIAEFSASSCRLMFTPTSRPRVTPFPAKRRSFTSTPVCTMLASSHRGMALGDTTV